MTVIFLLPNTDCLQQVEDYLNVSAFNNQVELPPLVHFENFFQGV
jgi:hypothetical protein